MTGQKVVDIALQQIGKPYVWATAGPDTYDCSGLVHYAMKAGAGLTISRDSHVLARSGTAVPETNLQPGDVLCYDTMGGGEVREGNAISHVGIYVAPGKMVNALNPGSGVVVSDPFSNYFKPLYRGARRIVPSPAPVPVKTITPQTPWRDIGDAPLEVWRSEFARKKSPMLPTVDQCWKAAHPHSALCLAMLAKESEYGTTGAGSAVHNPLNISCGWKAGRHEWCEYIDWWGGIFDWTLRLDGPAGPYEHTISLESLIHVYAPSTDGNNESEYVKQTANRINGYLSGGGGTPVPTPTRTKPVTYDIANPAHAAKFGLNADEVKTLLGYCITGRDGYKPKAIVWHIQDGVSIGSLDWWVHGVGQDGKKVLASASALVQKDGSILRVIPDGDGPWTNGDVQSPTAWGQEIASLGGGDPNRVSLTIEAEGTPDTPLTPAQDNAILWQTEEWMRLYAIPSTLVGPHSAINSVDRARCGLYAPRLKPLLNTGPVTPTAPTKLDSVALPDGITAADVRKWLGPMADPNGGVTVLLAEEGARTGVFSPIVEAEPAGPVRRFRCANGMTVIADSKGVRIARRTA